MKRLDSLPEELREAFDRAFAQPPPAPAAPVVSLLIIEPGEGIRVALRLDKLRGVHVNRRIVQLPLSPPELLGIAGLRGSVLPVWDLSLLLGMRRAGRGCRWIAECGFDEPTGFAFESLVSQIEIPEPDLKTDEGSGALFKAVVRFRDQPVGVLDLTSLVASLPVPQVRPGRHGPEGGSVDEMRPDPLDPSTDGPIGRRRLTTTPEERGRS